ncbi:MAG: FHA domain-containing protein [Phototrophicaceae bacterium]
MMPTSEFALHVAQYLPLVLLYGFMGLLAYGLRLEFQHLESPSRITNETHGKLIQLRKAMDDFSPTDKIYPIFLRTTIGRNGDNTLQIEDDYLSSNHAHLYLRDNIWWLEDLGSRNGTLLNNIEIKQAVIITHGDIISMGNIHLKIELDT